MGEAKHHLMNREMIGLLRPHAWLINAARGPLVDEAALYDALSSGRLAAAGVDVLVEEPAKAVTTSAIAAGLASAVRALPEEMAHYKSLPMFRAAMLAWLDRLVSDRREA